MTAMAYQRMANRGTTEIKIEKPKTTIITQTIGL
jgi:hypothetical protein